MKDKLDKLANQILDEATDPDVALDIRLDALKTVSAYYKMAPPTDEPGDGTPSMDDLRKQVAAAGAPLNGGASPRSQEKPDV